MNSINIYHCCIQKSASQWIKHILSDKRVYDACGLNTYTPDKDFIGLIYRSELKNKFPENTIITPFYIRYDEFKKIQKPDKYKAFWVMRDPRDLVISRYFSIKNSHVELIPSHKFEKEYLNKVSQEDGISYYIDAINKKHKLLYSSLTNWLEAKKDNNVLLCKYEDLTGENSFNTFKKIFNHCNINISDELLSVLLNNYSFRKITGRNQGNEDQYSHYRKGISNDWKNYFNENHINLFKKVAGDLLIKLDYEKDNNW